jgi:hypothetical protein
MVFRSSKETHSGEAGEHRQSEESSRLPLRAAKVSLQAWELVRRVAFRQHRNMKDIWDELPAKHANDPVSLAPSNDPSIRWVCEEHLWRSCDSAGMSDPSTHD